MSKRKVPVASKKRLVIFGSICIACVVYFFVTAISLFFNIRNLNNEEYTLKNDLADLKEEEVNLNKELEKLKNNEYKARYAREYFLYSKPENEYIFSLEDDASSDVVTNDDEYIYKYMIIGSIAFTSIVVLVFLVKLMKKKEDN